ncbi:uncharacterized protein G2W53_034523 [Senna tora]|uniref:Uncharacterized protein n=1 Tax=Senna tora TaxID=362788 RepID=A0A834W8Z7_9FABA|nr:uncharacterized protein G2W53_034523 [Senna tora]
MEWIGASPGDAESGSSGNVIEE